MTRRSPIAVNRLVARLMHVGCGLALANWVGIFAPRGTPKDIMGKFNSAVMSTLADPAIRARLIDLGVAIPAPEQQTPEGFAALQKADIEKWWPIIKAAGIRGE